MSEEVSMDALARMVRKVVREELELDDKRVTQAILKLLMGNVDVLKVSEKKPHEKRVITAGKD